MKPMKPQATARTVTTSPLYPPAESGLDTCIAANSFRHCSASKRRKEHLMPNTMNYKRQDFGALLHQMLTLSFMWNSKEKRTKNINRNLIRVFFKLHTVAIGPGRCAYGWITEFTLVAVFLFVQRMTFPVDETCIFLERNLNSILEWTLNIHD